MARHLWLPQLSSSFWLDETGTAWMIQGSLWDAISRSYRFQGGHTLFVVIEWLVKALTGSSEIALRMPSLLGMVGACYLIYRLGRRIFDHWVGLFAATFIVALPSVAFAATDARPYALAIMLLTGSSLALINWTESQRMRDAVIYAAVTAGVVYLHYMFILPLLAHAIYVLFRIRAGQRFEWRSLLTAPALLAVFLVPTIPNLIRVLHEADIYSNPYVQELHQIMDHLLPSTLMRVFIPAVLLLCLVSPPKLKVETYLRGSLPLIVGWIAIPAAVLYLASIRGTNVLVPRYFLMLVPAIALAIALAVRQLGHLEAQVGVLLLLFLSALRFLPTPTHTLENWRAAAEVEREAVTDPATPVLMFSGFIEGNQLSYLTDPERASYLNAPAAMYPMEGRLIPFPFSIGPATEGYLQEIVRSEVLPTDRFVFVSRGEIHKDWLDRTVGPAGFSPVLLASFDGSVTVFSYSR